MDIPSGYIILVGDIRSAYSIFNQKNKLREEGYRYYWLIIYTLFGNETQNYHHIRLNSVSAYIPTQMSCFICTTLSLKSNIKDHSLAIHPNTEQIAMRTHGILTHAFYASMRSHAHARMRLFPVWHTQKTTISSSGLISSLATPPCVSPQCVVVDQLNLFILLLAPSPPPPPPPVSILHSTMLSLRMLVAIFLVALLVSSSLAQDTTTSDTTSTTGSTATPTTAPTSTPTKTPGKTSTTGTTTGGTTSTTTKSAVGAIIVSVLVAVGFVGCVAKDFKDRYDNDQLTRPSFNV